MDIEQPFFLDGNRAMISLGPLTDTRYCPFNCAFCYVQDGFTKYKSMSDDEIIEFLELNKDNFNIIYVSGDTDSFAPPRTERALNLLKKISSKINCDLLFTTRTVFSEKELYKIKQVVRNLKQHNKHLFASVSVSRYSDSLKFIEPDPIPTPEARLNQIKKLKNIGAVTILAMRPFLPIVPKEDYFAMLNKTKGYADIALGESFYFKENGVVYGRVFPDGISEDIAREIHLENMTFDIAGQDYLAWDCFEYESAIREYAEKLGIIFSMHSTDAIDKFKQLTKNKTKF